MILNFGTEGSFKKLKIRNPQFEIKLDSSLTRHKIFDCLEWKKF